LSTPPHLRVRIRRAALACLLAAWAVVAWYHTHKALPPGLHLASDVCAAPQADAAFIADITAADAFGHQVMSQAIFDAVLALVRNAQHVLLLDYPSFAGEAAAAAPAEPGARWSAHELADAVLAQLAAHPQLQVLVITDPATESYGARRAPELERLRAAGIAVVATDLDRLRDSNPAYSSLWRLTARWWDRPDGRFGSALRRLNYKANARQLVIADDGAGGLAAVLGSANPGDAVSSSSNVALRIRGPQLGQLLASELALAHFSGWRGAPTLPPAAGCAAAPAPAESVQLLTEGAVQEALLQHLAASDGGDGVDVAMYRIADRAVVEALLGAARRGVAVRLILDPNDGAGSGGAAGIPNQVVASELVSRSSGAIRVRWYRTHGERFHSALVVIYGRQRLWLLAGSANLTSRSLDDLNLVADAAVAAPSGSALAQQALGYFDALWSNRAAPGMEYTADFDVRADPSQSDYWLYRLLEASGFSAF
jgi:phosphatidylserine/phosphatidylglycerophosphate/cardiolipin synthase-like enzyme